MKELIRNKKVMIGIGAAVLAVAVAVCAAAGIRSRRVKGLKDTEVSSSEAPEETSEVSSDGTEASLTPILTDEVTAGAYSDGAEYGTNLEGSAIYPEGTTVIVTIQASVSDDRWGAGDLVKAKKKLSTALDFISSEAKNKYGKTVKFVNGKDDLVFDYTYSGSDDIGQLVYDDCNSLLNDFVSENVDADAIRKKYSADGIAYVYLLNGLGENYASVHYASDDDYTYNEAAYLYFYDYDSQEDEECTPAQYARQILQLFGAVKLVEPDAQNGYTTALDNIVRSDYSNDIMFTTLDSELASNQDRIENEITDITAYTIGLTDSFEGLSENASFTKQYRCGFADGLSVNTKGGTDYSEYEDDPAWEEDSYEDSPDLYTEVSTDEYYDDTTDEYYDDSSSDEYYDDSTDESYDDSADDTYDDTSDSDNE